MNYFCKLDIFVFTIKPQTSSQSNYCIVNKIIKKIDDYVTGFYNNLS